MGDLTHEQELFKSKAIADREGKYHADARKIRGTKLSPERDDFFTGVGVKRTHK